MAIWISIPVLGSLVIIQSVIASRIALLQGTADIVMLAIIAWALQKRVMTAWHWAIIGGLLVSFVSGLPFGIPIISYSIAVGIALALRQRVWQVPMLAMFTTTLLGTICTQIIVSVTLSLTGISMPIFYVLSSITLPSILLNLLLAIPFYALLGELASWLYPEELEI